MRREYSPVVISIVSVLLLIVSLFIAFQLLKRLPSNYLSKLPKAVQHLVIPEPDSSFLPPAPVPINVEALLEVAQVIEPTPTLVQPIVSAVAVTSADTAVVEPTRPADSEKSETVIEAFASSSNEAEVAGLSPAPEFFRLNDFTFHKQDWNNCGPATLAMQLSYFKTDVTQYDTASYLKPNYEDRNVTPQQMVDYVNNFTSLKALNRVNGNIDTLKQLISAGFPLIIEVGDRAPTEVSWIDSEAGVAYRDWWGHYLLTVGYDDSLSEIWVYDSLIWDIQSEINTPDGHSYSYEDLLTFWPQFNGSYIIMYESEREADLAEILGADFDLVTMWQNALARNQRALQNQPDNAFLWFNLGTAYNSLGQHADAAKAFDKARGIGLPWRMLWYQFGPYEAYYNTGQYQQIILLANATLASRPYFEESYFWRGKAEEALGDITGATNDFNAAVNFNPNFQPAVDALANLQ